MSKGNRKITIERSLKRGGGARGTEGFSDNGRDAVKRSQQSKKGYYRVEFTVGYDRVTERDLELREVYGIDLLSESLGVPIDMIRLEPMRDSEIQTITSLNEVFYVWVGKRNYGKLSIRTRRVHSYRFLTYIYQKRTQRLREVSPSFNQRGIYDRESVGQRQHRKRANQRIRGGR